VHEKEKNCPGVTIPVDIYMFYTLSIAFTDRNKATMAVIRNIFYTCVLAFIAQHSS